MDGDATAETVHFFIRRKNLSFYIQGDKSMSSKIVQEGLTFDDVLLIPQASNVLPADVSLKTKLTDNMNKLTESQAKSHIEMLNTLNNSFKDIMQLNAQSNEATNSL